MSSVTGESRKIVTVLFSDVTGSTGIGHELDPESLRHLMARYFGEMEAVLRRHGGSVEKFVGDAVMAVFGIPRSHEDDAVRAVRAALEMRAALDGLNDEFHRTWGVSLTTRTLLSEGFRTDSGGTVVAPLACHPASRSEPVARDEALVAWDRAELCELGEEPPLQPASVIAATAAMPMARKAQPVIT